MMFLTTAPSVAQAKLGLKHRTLRKQAPVPSYLHNLLRDKKKGRGAINAASTAVPEAASLSKGLPSNDLMTRSDLKGLKETASPYESGLGLDHDQVGEDLYVADRDVNPQPDAKQFSWTRAWHPAFPIALMDKERPQALAMFGRKLVIWLDGQGEWKCMEDTCPHRSAPLSEGRLMNGNLMCSYHGWQFNGQGKCVSIPQMPPHAKATACQNQRSCVRTSPTLVANGLLYVWPDASPTAFVDSAASWPACLPEFAKDNQPWAIAVLPVQFSTAIEQALDPSHLPFLHHGGAACNMEHAVPMEAGRIEKVDLQSGFEWRHGACTQEDTGMQVIRTFHPPNAILVRYMQPNGGGILAQTYFVPATPTTTRSLVRTEGLPTPSDKKSALSLALLQTPIKNWLSHLLPEWWSHSKDDVFLLQDTIMTQRQEERSKDLTSYSSAYFMPAPSDHGLVALQKWLRLADYEHLWQSLGVPAPPLVEKDDFEVADIWNYHTRHCAVCQKGVAQMQVFIERARRAATILAATSLAAAAVTAAGNGHVLLVSVASAALAVLALASAYAVEFKQKLYFNKAHLWQKKGGVSLVPRA